MAFPYYLFVVYESIMYTYLINKVSAMQKYGGSGVGQTPKKSSLSIPNPAVSPSNCPPE